MYDCMRSERESASHSSAPQLKAVSDLYMCTHARVCWYHFVNLSTVSVCPPVHTVTQTHAHTHTQATLKTHANTCQVLIENTSFEMNREDTIVRTITPTQVHT
jgi:hypothetical protein